jgi:flagellar secretion chaperone FliS
MPNNPYNAYLDASILTAEPIELIRTLYRVAIDAVCEARAHLASGNIRERSKAVSKAHNILRELSASVKPEAEPALGRNLVELYDYMQRRLLTGNLEQKDAPLKEVADLLANMAEAWERIDVRDSMAINNGTERAEAVEA